MNIERKYIKQINESIKESVADEAAKDNKRNNSIDFDSFGGAIEIFVGEASYGETGIEVSLNGASSGSVDYKINTELSPEDPAFRELCRKTREDLTAKILPIAQEFDDKIAKVLEEVQAVK